MPSDNESAYKEMYEMGKRLMEMAEAGGYSEEGESSDEYSMEESASQPSSGSGDKAAAALSYM